MDMDANDELSKARIDEALVLFARSLELRFRYSQCFGCDSRKAPSAAASSIAAVYQASDNSIAVLSTKRALDLTIVEPTSGAIKCELSQVSLTSRAHYQLAAADVTALDSNAEAAESQCKLRLVKLGDCVLCPIAVLVGAVLVACVIDALVSAWLAAKSGARHTPVAEQPQDAIVTTSATPDDHRHHRHHDNDHTNEEATTGPVAAASGLQKARIDSLDVFRGLTMMLMIMVNFGGAGYSQLEHSDWNGLTLADCVFPFFIFILGASVALAMRRSSRPAAPPPSPFPTLLARVSRRAAGLTLMGVCLNSMSLADGKLGNLRFPGVLQRLAVVYAAVALVQAARVSLGGWLQEARVLGVAREYRGAVAARVASPLLEPLLASACLGAYLLVTLLAEAGGPSCPRGYLGPGGDTERGLHRNCTGGAAGALDRAVLGTRHLYADSELRVVFNASERHDPEGLVGNATAVLLALIGLQCGKALALRRGHSARLAALVGWSLVALLGALICLSFIPVNKKLFSLTFVLLTAALAALSLAAAYLLVDILKLHKRLFVLRLFQAAGQKALLVYVGHFVLSNALPFNIGVDEQQRAAKLARVVWAAFAWLVVAHLAAVKTKAHLPNTRINASQSSE